jgi:hypothetical protein
MTCVTESRREIVLLNRSNRSLGHSGTAHRLCAPSNFVDYVIARPRNRSGGNTSTGAERALGWRYPRSVTRGGCIARPLQAGGLPAGGETDRRAERKSLRERRLSNFVQLAPCRSTSITTSGSIFSHARSESRKGAHTPFPGPERPTLPEGE